MAATSPLDRLEAYHFTIKMGLNWLANLVVYDVSDQLLSDADLRLLSRALGIHLPTECSPQTCGPKGEAAKSLQHFATIYKGHIGDQDTLDRLNKLLDYCNRAQKAEPVIKNPPSGRPKRNHPWGY